MTISVSKEETPDGTKFTMTNHINFERYQEFVAAVTSDASTNFVDFADRIGDLDRQGANIERLLTAGVGINAEGGEFLEIIKKMVFQGKPWNEDNREHLIIELGDVMWYVAQATMALDISFDEVIETNVNKLKKRYPGGEFNVHNSEVRAAGDR
jgi:NTP pyrophosphatase (non-canonical NTP hydrolase)